ncbi:MAG TPA: DUF3078 domain-containing protein [Cyclobacteriaceae bacterium]|nr:DUF3078 domain-containing protein [Cyclobacteriaceae bacterium]
MRNIALIPLCLILLITCLSSVNLYAQEEAAAEEPAPDPLWKRKLIFSFNFNQSAFSSNWKAGGINSVGFNSLLNYKANYKKDNNSWNNEFDFLYGFVNNEGQGYRKTLDRVFIDSRYGRKVNEKWDMTIAGNFITQFTAGYNYATEPELLISDLFAPAFLTASVGFENKPNDFFRVRLSPFAPRITIVRDVERFITAESPTPFGVQPGENARYEWLAAQILAEFNKDIVENVNLKWRYILFANYEELAFNKLDHRLDLNITAKIAKYFNVSLGAIMLYDFDQDDKVQYSQAFSFGFLYTLQNFAEK